MHSPKSDLICNLSRFARQTAIKRRVGSVISAGVRVRPRNDSGALFKQRIISGGHCHRTRLIRLLVFVISSAARFWDKSILNSNGCASAASGLVTTACGRAHSKLANCCSDVRRNVNQASASTHTHRPTKSVQQQRFSI